MFVPGIDAYQRASLAGESEAHYQQFNASVWVLAHPALVAARQQSQTQTQMQPPGGPGSEQSDTPTDMAGQRSGRPHVRPAPAGISLLDVGAIRNHYVDLPHVRATAIDLNPQDPSVQQADLISFVPRHPASGFDVVVLSFVLNFDGDPRRRGDMLRKARTLLTPDGLGLVFIVLPLACVNNSRYCDLAVLGQLAAALGFVVQSHKLTAKLALLVWHVFFSSISSAFALLLSMVLPVSLLVGFLY